jgi:hypothetical protein
LATCGRVQLRLLLRLVEGVDALDGDAHGPERHDEQHHGDGHGHHAHLLEHLDEVEAGTLLREGRGADQRHCKPGKCDPPDLTQLPTFHRIPPEKVRVTVENMADSYCSVNCTVTVMMTGTGTPLRSVGVNCH